MATESELKIMREEMLFDFARLLKTKDAKKKEQLIRAMYIRATAGMTKEEIADVEQKAAFIVEAEAKEDAN